MMKKIIVGGAAAALVVVGVASAAQLSGTSETTMAGGQISVSGAELEGVGFSTTYIGGGVGNGEKTNIVSSITLDLDKADVSVSGRILQDVHLGNDYAKDVNGKKGGYLADSSATKFDGKVTDADGKVTFDLAWQQIPVENVDALDILVTG